MPCSCSWRGGARCPDGSATESSRQPSRSIASLGQRPGPAEHRPQRRREPGRPARPADAHPRHRRRRVHQRLPRPGAARAPATRSSGSTTSASTAGWSKSYDDHPRYRFVEGDAKDAALMTELAADCDQVVAAAAMIGGISYFHEFAYDLLAENERILAADVRRRDRRPPRRAARADRRASAARWSTSRRRSSRRPRARS